MNGGQSDRVDANDGAVQQRAFMVIYSQQWLGKQKVKVLQDTGCNSQIHKKRGTSKYRIWSNSEAESWSKDVKTMRNNCEEMVGVKDSEVKGNK